MTQKFKINGIISAMVTPFTKGGENVDYEKVGPLANLILSQGAHGLFPCGTTSEGMLMTPDERRETLEEVLRSVDKKVPVIAHTGTFDTATTIELTRHARDCGATAASIVAPGYYAYDDASLFTYYKSIARAVDGFPILLYNIPSCARNVLHPELVIRLAESEENIVGIKDSSGSMQGITRMIGNTPDGFSVICGVDDYGYQAILAGCPAVVSGLSNVVCEIYAAVYNNIIKGDLKKAWKEEVRLEKAARLFKYGQMLAAFKEGLRMRGFDAGYARPPQRELTAAEKRNLKKGLEEIGII
ncbi:MAG: dihydrodipicolinate synthase family protein [Candidatus Hydrogenedentes bacterium]|jgi:dihydrodipicolinate synthase/N-acetylneuraminate lyase|nr:dihydrodipicolinate synthase family protein [Candidatus Hydrogenedentota bacterium]